MSEYMYVPQANITDPLVYDRRVSLVNKRSEKVQKCVSIMSSLFHTYQMIIYVIYNVKCIDVTSSQGVQ